VFICAPAPCDSGLSVSDAALWLGCHMSAAGVLRQSDGRRAHVLPETLPVSEMETPSQTSVGRTNKHLISWSKCGKITYSGQGLTNASKVLRRCWFAKTVDKCTSRLLHEVHFTVLPASVFA